MVGIPAYLSLLGFFMGRWYAQRQGQCPHRGRVWGAFLFPLFALAIPALQLQAILVSMAAALASGLTAHHSLKLSLVVTLLAVIAAAVGSTFL